jgi:exodeoxyribonuclease VII large subunit
LPIITGIGHEIDTSIADLVADYHAHTPTEAATVAIRNWLRAAELVTTGTARLRNATRTIITDARQQLIGITRHEFFRRPMYRVDSYRQLIDERQRALTAALTENLQSASVRIERLQTRLAASHPRHRLALQRHRLHDMERRLNRAIAASLQRQSLHLTAKESQLRAISPIEVLRRGYSITMLKKSNQILRSPDQIAGGELLITRTAGGDIESIAKDPKQQELF